MKKKEEGSWWIWQVQQTPTSCILVASRWWGSTNTTWQKEVQQTDWPDPLLFLHLIKQAVKSFLVQESCSTSCSVESGCGRIFAHIRALYRDKLKQKSNQWPACVFLLLPVPQYAYCLFHIWRFWYTNWMRLCFAATWMMWILVMTNLLGGKLENVWNLGPWPSHVVDWSNTSVTNRANRVCVSTLIRLPIFCRVLLLKIYYNWN